MVKARERSRVCERKHAFLTYVQPAAARNIHSARARERERSVCIGGSAGPDTPHESSVFEPALKSSVALQRASAFPSLLLRSYVTCDTYRHRGRHCAIVYRVKKQAAYTFDSSDMCARQRADALLLVSTLSLFMRTNLSP